MTTNIRSYKHFSEMIKWQQVMIIKKLSEAPGCLIRDLKKFDPPVAVAYFDSIVPIGIAAMLPVDKRYKRKAQGIECFVVPKWRGQGIARELIEVLIKRFRDYDEPNLFRWWDAYSFFRKLFKNVRVDGKYARSGELTIA